MKIVLLGSWEVEDHSWNFSGTHDAFSAACRAIGRRLTASRATVTVGGSGSQTADIHVVSGMVAAAEGAEISDPLIEVNTPARDRAYYLELATRNPTLFSFTPQRYSSWTEASLMALREADAVLTIGGMSTTYNGALAAVVARKRVVPIGSFGGASLRLLGALETFEEQIPIGALRVLAGPWGPHILDTAARVLGLGQPIRLLLIHGRSDDRFQLEVWLKRHLQGIEIIVMQEEFGASRALPEKFESLASQVDGAIALATPDDKGAPVDDSDLRLRARQNVWLEVGWFWGKLGRKKVMVLCKEELEIPSDLSGIQLYPYRRSPVEVAEEIRTFVTKLSGTH